MKTMYKIDAETIRPGEKQRAGGNGAEPKNKSSNKNASYEL